MKNYFELLLGIACVLCVSACLMMLCSCKSTSHDEAKPISYGQTTCKIKVTKDERGTWYSVSGKLLKENCCRSPDGMQADADTIEFPTVHINLNQWGEVRMTQANDKVRFETLLCLDGESIKITHNLGIYFKVKLIEKDKSSVRVSGVMLQTSFKDNKPVVCAYPINNIDCKLNSEVCFYSQKIIKPESLTKEQSDNLADCIIRQSPNLEWVALEGIKDNPEILNAAVLEKLKRKYKVFNTRDDIPGKFIMGKQPGNHEVATYTKGFIFKYKITFDSSDSVTVISERYIGPKNASGGEVKYKWNGKEWVTIHIAKMWIS